MTTTERTMLDLAPCPFCDSPAHFTERDCPPIGTRYGVRCTECDCWCDYRERSKEAATERWNWRKPVSHLRFELENARAVLLKQGYCAAGDHGTGDPEINRIDAALATLATTQSQQPAWREALRAEIDRWANDERALYPDNEILESLDRIVTALAVPAQPSLAIADVRGALEIKPSVYGYQYHDCIRFNHGQEVNGGRPTSTVPFYDQKTIDRLLAALPQAQTTSCRFPECECSADAMCPEAKDRAPSPDAPQHAPEAGREDLIHECADIADKYDDCGGAFIAEKIRALALRPDRGSNTDQDRANG